MNSLPTISTHTASELQPPRCPRYGGKARQPTQKAVERICERIATERGLTLNNALYGYGAANKAARREAFKAIVAETGCSISGLADTLGRDRAGLYRAIAYEERPRSPAAPRQRRKPSTSPKLSLASGESPGGRGLPVRPEVRDAMVAAVAAAHGLRPDDILNRQSRDPLLVPARHEVMWRLRQIRRDGKPKHSFPAIGLALDAHHSSVMLGVATHEATLATSAGRVAA